MNLWHKNKWAWRTKASVAPYRSLGEFGVLLKIINLVTYSSSWLVLGCGVFFLPYVFIATGCPFSQRCHGSWVYGEQDTAVLDLGRVWMLCQCRRHRWRAGAVHKASPAVIPAWLVVIPQNPALFWYRRSLAMGEMCDPLGGSKLLFAPTFW